MRKIIGMPQTEYAEKILKIYPRVLMEIERDRGNPTLETAGKDRQAGWIEDRLRGKEIAPEDGRLD